MIIKAKFALDMLMSSSTSSSRKLLKFLRFLRTSIASQKTEKFFATKCKQCLLATCQCASSSKVITKMTQPWFTKPLSFLPKLDLLFSTGNISLKTSQRTTTTPGSTKHNRKLRSLGTMKNCPAASKTTLTNTPWSLKPRTFWQLL
jgi:hypothetical protein